MPIKTALIAQTQASGVEPFTTLISPVRRCLSRETYAFRTIRQINSVKLGVLLPAQYRSVCDRTLQSVKLAKSDLTSAIRLSQRLDGDAVAYTWISVYIPLKLALKADSAEIIEEILTAENFRETSKICLEIPSDALYEDLEKITASLKNFKSRGFTTALSSFGDEFCPINRLYGLPIDVCMFDESAAKRAETSESARSVSAMIAFAKTNESDAVACIGKKNVKPDIYARAGFSGYTSCEDGETGWMTYEDYIEERQGG